MRAEKQSGVRGVTWDRGHKSWNVTWRCCEPDGATRQPSVKRFPAATFQRPRQDPEAANAAALQAAVALRKDLEESGRAKRLKVPERQSGVRGVTWLPKKRKWLARLQVVFNGKKYDVQFAPAASFRPRDNTPEEMERTRLLAVAHVQKLER